MQYETSEDRPVSTWQVLKRGNLVVRSSGRTLYLREINKGAERLIGSWRYFQPHTELESAEIMINDHIKEHERYN